MATIIRQDGTRQRLTGQAVRSVALDLTDIRGRADDYLETVRHEAAKIVHQAHEQAEQVRRQAEAAGRQAAEQAIERILEEKIAKRMETILPALQKVIAEIADAKGLWLEQWERSAVHVSASIAERIIRRQLDRQPEIALELIRESLELAVGAADITLHLNPSDHEHLGSQVTQLANAVSQLAPTAVVTDPGVSPGGCRVETKYGEIDQRIESQLRRIEEELA